ncbi:MAG TPA: DUF4440 domain-containing protein [Blastocatellia bacterium]|nr:DUF4440 domain-containing protein [Blastocatellia bacterium]
MSQSSNTIDDAINRQAAYQAATPSEPYFFDVMDPANKGLSAKELDDLLLDSFLFIDINGQTWNKVQVVEELLKGDCEFETFEHSDIRVVNWGQDKAYVQRSVITAKGKYLGLELNGQYRCASMVLREPTGWKLFNCQLTQMK